jgi:hypothetical protein
MKKSLSILVCVSMLAFSSVAWALSVTTTGDSEVLVDAILGTGVYNVQNISYTAGGVPHASGTFSNGTTSGIGIESGIILSTGNAADAVGPNTVDNITTRNYLPGDSDLAALAGYANTYDATVLEFDFDVNTAGTLSFNYVFASDEYNEWTNSQYNDVFAFLLDGTNIALIPETDIPVAINTVNGGGPAYGSNPSYSQYYNNNNLDDGGPYYDIEYDGFTVVFAATADIGEGTHHIKLAITDVSDPFWDSGVFIEEGSFSFVPTTNATPVADAGENITISSKGIATTVISGNATDEDPDDYLEYQWKEGEEVLLGWTHADQCGECPLELSTILIGTGTHTLTLEVRDGQAISSDEMILTIDNSAPHVAATGGGCYEVNTDVILGGFVSDFDGDPVEYKWKEGSNVLSFGTIETIEEGYPVELEPYTTANLGLGVHVFVLEVCDGHSPPVTSTITVEIKDTGEPTLAPVPNQTILWPPNHKMVDIVIEANASDESGLPVTLTAQVKSNEPIDGLGDGDTAPDWAELQIDQGTGTITLQLRAERSGSDNGRIYTITITATDDSSNSSTADVEIIVPHDKGKK